MTQGTIDRASAVMVPVFLTYQDPQTADAWARDCALGFTLIALFTEHIAFAPNPTKDQSISGLWGEFVSGLPGYTKSETRPSASAEAKALASAHLISRSPQAISSALLAAKADPSFQPWVNWHARFQLVEHSRRLNGLFDFQFLEQIADVLGISPQEMKRLWDRSRDPAAVESLCVRLLANKLTSEDQHIIEAWLTSTLMRGAYHDELARIRHRQNYRHPVRALLPYADDPGRPRPSIYEPNPAEKYFASMILGISIKADKSPVRRIKLYNQNATAARRARMNGMLALGDRASAEGANPITDEIGLSRAIREASWMIRNGILDVGGSKTATALEIAAGLSSTGIGFALTPWAGLAVGALSATAQATLHPGRRIMIAKGARPQELAKLAQAVAGPVDVTEK